MVEKSVYMNAAVGVCMCALNDAENRICRKKVWSNRMPGFDMEPGFELRCQAGKGMRLSKQRRIQTEEKNGH